MIARTVAVAGLAATLAACSSGRGGLVDATLDRSLYTAETKAERLLRYYEIQALLVRYAALFGGTKSERNAIAAANVVATGRLNEVFNCLHYGSLKAEVTVQMKEATSRAVRSTNYCSFFDTRMVSYEAALLNLMRQATGYDEQLSEIKAMVTGFSVMDVWTLATNLLSVAEHVVRDAHVLRAFRADARELQLLVWQKELIGPETVDADRTYDGIHPERDKPEVVEQALAARDGGPSRPTVLVWHFQEVSAFLRDSCVELNDDAKIKDFGETHCSSHVPFLDTPPAAAAKPVSSTATPDAPKVAAAVAADAGLTPSVGKATMAEPR